MKALHILNDGKIVNADLSLMLIGFQMQQLHDITVFENNLYVITWLDNSINALRKLDASSHTPIVKNLSKPFALHVYHRQRQPPQSNAQPSCCLNCIGLS